MLNKRLAYSPREVSELLGVHINTILKYVDRGVLPAQRLGKRILIPATELEKWLQEHNQNMGGER